MKTKYIVHYGRHNSKQEFTSKAEAFRFMSYLLKDDYDKVTLTKEEA